MDRGDHVRRRMIVLLAVAGVLIAGAGGIALTATSTTATGTGLAGQTAPESSGIVDRSAHGLYGIAPQPSSAEQSVRAAALSTNRSIESTTVAPGETVQVETTVTVEELPDNGTLSIVEIVDAEVVTVELDAVTRNGTDIQPAIALAGADRVVVGVNRSGLSPGAAVTVSYSMTVPNDATAGDSVGLDGTATLGETEQSVGAETFDVATPDVFDGLNRDVEPAEPQTGETVAVVLEATVADPAPDGHLVFEDVLSPTPSGTAMQNVTVDGTPVEPTLAVATPEAVVVGVDRADVSEGDTVALRYEVTIPPTAADGSTLGLNGTASFGSATAAASTTLTVSRVDPIAAVDRSADTGTAAPGEAVTITTTVDLGTLPAAGGLSIGEQLSAADAETAVESVAVGGDSVTPAYSLADDGTVLVGLDRDALAPDESVTLTYTVEVPPDAASGDELSAAGTVRAGEREASVPSTTIQVQEAASFAAVDRSFNVDGMVPGGTIVATTTVEVDEPAAAGGLSIHEQFTSPVNGSAVEGVAVDGEPVSPALAVATDEELIVAVDGTDLGPNATVDLRYGIDIDEAAAVGDTGSVDGTVSYGTAGSTVPTDTVDVIEEPGLPAYADEDGVVRTPGLREAVRDWRAGLVDAETLQAALEAWESGDPIE